MVDDRWPLPFAESWKTRVKMNFEFWNSIELWNWDATNRYPNIGSYLCSTSGNWQSVCMCKFMVSWLIWFKLKAKPEVDKHFYLPSIAFIVVGRSSELVLLQHWIHLYGSPPKPNLKLRRCICFIYVFYSIIETFILTSWPHLDFP